MKTWRSLWQLARYRPWLLCFESLIRLVWSGSFIIEGLLLRAFFDQLSGQDTVYHNPAWSLIALLVVTRIVRIGMLFSGIFTQIISDSVITTLLRRNILHHILTHPNRNIAHSSIGDTISYLRDDPSEVTDFTSVCLWVIVSTLSAMIAIAILIQINLLITLVIFIPFLAVIGIVYITRMYIEQYRKISRKATGRVIGMLSEMFGTIQAIKVAHAEKRMIERFHKLDHERGSAMIKDRLLTALLQSISGNATHLSIGAMLLLAAQSIQAGAFSIGDFALFVYYLGWIAELPTRFGRLLAGYKRVRISFERMLTPLKGVEAQSLINHAPIYLRGALPELLVPKKASSDQLELLEVRGLSYHYPNSTNGIEDIQLRIARGSFIVVTGRVGSGKTTLLRTILGSLPKEKGEICWNGQLLEQPAAFLIPPRCAYIAQSPRLFSETIKDNILMGLPEHTDIDAAIRSAVLERDLSAFPAGLESQIGPSGVKLSGGQQKRIAVARMFVRDAELLIFDDFSSALDVETEEIFWQRLSEQPHKTYLVVSHSRAAFQRAEQIIVLKQGRVEAAGPLDMLLQHSQEMQDLWQGKRSWSP